MILGADLVKVVFSVEGIVFFLVAAAVWILISNSSGARKFLYAVALFYGLASLHVVPTAAVRPLSSSFHPFRATDLPTGSRNAIVVLGSGSTTVADWWGDNYSVVDRDAAQRVLEAAHVYKLIGADYVISSGGDPHPTRRRAPSGQTMREALVALGVPPERILVETSSLTTHDEALIVKSMIADRPIDRLVLVTSRSHMLRALGAFRAAGIDCTPAIAADFDFGDDWLPQLLPTREGLSASGVIVHEFLGLVYYSVRGWWKR